MSPRAADRSFSLNDPDDLDAPIADRNCGRSGLSEPLGLRNQATAQGRGIRELRWAFAADLRIPSET
jgi:hypothetical protein